jgi:hypothetical protein
MPAMSQNHGTPRLLGGSSSSLRSWSGSPDLVVLI